MRPDRAGLDVYLRSVNEQIQTMKMSSELWFRSPSRRQIKRNDQFVRSLISSGFAKLDTPLPHSEPDVLWHAYQDAITASRDIAVRFGAAGHETLGGYFRVAPERSSEAALEKARKAASSPAVRLLRSVDRSASSESVRRAMIALSREWRKPLLLNKSEATELASVYMIGRYPFTADELRVANRLVATRRLRSALLAAQLQLVEESRNPLSTLVTEFRTSRVLLPFTEAVVNRHGYNSAAPITLAPNPKLITVLCNNIVPAIAGESIRTRRRLDAELVRAGVAAARRRHVFEIMIALFDEAGGRHPDEVALSGFSMRVCPAAVPVFTFLERWLPYYFDLFSRPHNRTN